MRLRMCIWKKIQGIPEVAAGHQDQSDMTEARTVPQNHQSHTQSTLMQTGTREPCYKEYAGLGHGLVESVPV